MVKKARVGILGGSFNPPHLGHVGIARHVLKEGEVDQVWVIPCWEHPFDKNLIPFEHRFKMCELAFQEFGDKAKVSDVEQKLGGKSYTLRTVQQLKKENPDHAFFLVLGEDAVKETGSWHQIDQLKKEIEWLIVPRGKTSPVPNISSTEVRQTLQKKTGLVTLLSRSVIDYIAANKLY